MTTKLSTMRAFCALSLFAAVVACDAADVSEPSVAAEAEAEDSTPDAGSDEITALRGIDREFADAAAEFDVPLQILQAVGYVETQWQMVEGEAEFEGQEPAFGVMALRGAHLEIGASLVGASVEDVKFDRETNIRAGAALLRSYADEQELDRRDLNAWALAVAAMTDIADEDALASYIHHDVYGAIRNGVVISDIGGKTVAELRPNANISPDFAAPSLPSSAPGPDYAGSVWRPSPNVSSRAGNPVKMVIIHSCEGSYAGCWGYLVSKSSGVSAHYVVKEDGSEISQLVKEASKAWHIGATYDCKNNSGKECGLNGKGSNSFTVGIEHAGYANQPSWNANLVNQSAKLACDISKAHNIPRDKYHFVAHGQLQPYNRTDPGPNWPWATYINKINEHCGASSPQPGSAIVIDNNPANNDPAKTKVVVSSNWSASASTPGYYGSGYRFANTAPVSDGVEFWFHLPAPATKIVDAWWTSGSNRSAKAPFIAFDAAGNKLGTKYADQRYNGGKWVPLAKFNFKAGWNKVVLSRWTTEGAVVMADAVRIR